MDTSEFHQLRIPIRKILQEFHTKSEIFLFYKLPINQQLESRQELFEIDIDKLFF